MLDLLEVLLEQVLVVFFTLTGVDPELLILDLVLLAELFFTPVLLAFELKVLDNRDVEKATCDLINERTDS